MIASLPMYWRAETAQGWRLFWRHVQEAGGKHGLDLPPLTAPGDLGEPLIDHWLRPDLALSMTCGLPFRGALRDRVTYVATLDFGLGTPAGHYASVIVARPGTDLTRSLRLAYNAADSQSGWAVTQGRGPDHPGLRFGGYVETGSHAGSMRAVAEGRADVAFLDAVTWRLLQRGDPQAGEVQVIGQTVPGPGLPFITARGTDPGPLQAALAEAVQTFAPDDPMMLGGPLGLAVLAVAEYHALPLPAPPPRG